jgi:hypothetical protein
MRQKKEFSRELPYQYHDTTSNDPISTLSLSVSVNIDGFVKSPASALCCISQSFNVRKVRLMITKFARLKFELFTKPSKSGFLRVHQHWLVKKRSSPQFFS